MVQVTAADELTKVVVADGNQPRIPAMTRNDARIATKRRRAEPRRANSVTITRQPALQPAQRAEADHLTHDEPEIEPPA